MRCLRWTLIQYGWCPYKRTQFEHRPVCVQTEEHVKTQGEDGCLQARREASEQVSPAGTLILDFSPPDCEEIPAVEAAPSVELTQPVSPCSCFYTGFLTVLPESYCVYMPIYTFPIISS